MDTFFEQILPVRKGAKDVLAVLGIWAAAFVVGYLAFYFLFSFLTMISLFIIVGAFYGAYKLSGNFNVEYEYIITNGTFDIDKIMAKSSRKRLASFELSAVSRIERFNHEILKGGFSKKIIACNPDENSFVLVLSSGEGAGTCMVVSPNDRMKEAMVRFLPRHLADGAFK